MKKKDVFDFYVQRNTKKANDIEEIVKCLDTEKGKYNINYIDQRKRKGKKLPILELKLSTGEIYEYDETEMFQIILNVLKLGMKLSSK